MEKENHTRKIAIGLKPSDYSRLEVLAKTIGKPPAVTVRDIIVQYLDTHADDIIRAQKAASAYNDVMLILNGKNQISLFNDDDIN